MVYACKTSCAKSITGVLPYFPYSKQCKMRKRGSIVSKLIACMMCKAGECRAVSSHGLQGSDVFRGSFDMRVEWVRQISSFTRHSRRSHPPDHHGPPSEGDSGLLQHSSGQPEGISIPAPVHTGGGKTAFTVNALHCCFLSALELRPGVLLCDKRQHITCGSSVAQAHAVCSHTHTVVTLASPADL